MNYQMDEEYLHCVLGVSRDYRDASHGCCDTPTDPVKIFFHEATGSANESPVTSLFQIQEIKSVPLNLNKLYILFFELAMLFSFVFRDQISQYQRGYIST